MTYTFAGIVEQEDVDETWVPRVIDKQGSVQWHDDDGRRDTFTATGLTIYHGKVDDKAKLLAVRDVSIQVHITRARLVAVCRKYDKGGGWIGSPTAMIVANAVSIARARARSHGKFLVGQLRWPWLSDVGYTEKTSWLSANQLRLVAMDGETSEWLYIDFELGKRENARRLAEQVVTAAGAARAAYPYLDDEQRAKLATLTLPSYDPSSRRFATVRLPGARKAKASTAYPEVKGPESPAAPEPAALVTPADPGGSTPPAAPSAPVPSVESAALAAPAADTPRTAPAAPARPASPAPPGGGHLWSTPPATPAPTSLPGAEDEPQCADCGHRIPPGARFCRGCGLPVSVEPEPTMPEPAADPEPAACPQCGLELPERARFCRGCGHLLIEEPAPEHPPAEPCASCAAPLAEGAGFCRACGAQPVAPEPVEPPAGEGPRCTTVRAVDAGRSRPVDDFGVDLLGPAGRVRTHQVRLPDQPSAPAFAVQLEALPVGGIGPECAGLASIVIGRSRIVGVLTEGVGPDGPVSEGRGRVLVFELALRELDAVELTRGRLRRAQGVLTTILDPPYAIRMIAAAKRGPDGSFERSGQEELADALIVACCDARLQGHLDPALRRQLERIRAGARAEEETNLVAEFYLDGAAALVERGRTARPRTPVLAAAAALLVAVVVGTGAFLATRDDEAAAGTDPAAGLGEVATARASEEPAGTPEATPEPVEATPTATAEPPAALTAAFDGGRYARIGSFRTQERAEEVVGTLGAEGIDARALHSDEAEGMLPAFWVVVAGPFDSRADERRLKRDARRAGFGDAFVDDLQPATTPIDIAALDGLYSGDLQQTNGKVKRLNRTIPASISFSDQGSYGLVNYDDPLCTGELTPLSQEGAVATYSESIIDGDCTDGGVWHVRLDGDELLATWWREDDLTFVIGRLKP